MRMGISSKTCTERVAVYQTVLLPLTFGLDSKGTSPEFGNITRQHASATVLQQAEIESWTGCRCQELHNKRLEEAEDSLTSQRGKSMD